jgi:hypothetical protein
MGIRRQQFTHLFFVIGISILWPKLGLAQNTLQTKVDSSALGKAQEEFSQRRFVEALQIYRSYLREHPEDQDTWTRFAATYYHTGQARQALDYLRKSKPSPRLRGFNLYYQALCLNAISDRMRARRYLTKVSKMDDPIAEDALFELAAMEFEDADSTAARAAAEEYLKRFREGRFRPQMEMVLNRLAIAGKIEVEGTQQARYRTSFFDQNPLSLFSIPHLWYYQLGYYYESGSRSNPAYGSNRPIIETGIGYEEFKLNANLGLGLGPFKGKNTESYVGYIYEQDWLSDGDRLQVWTEDPVDIQYFPFRPDLMERRHRLFVETSGQKGDFLLGAYAHWQFSRAGSEFFPAPERPEIRKAFDIGTESLFVPWVEWNYHPQHSARAYLLFQKTLNREQSDFSNKSYNFFSSSIEPFLSLTLEHNSNFPQFDGLRLSIEAFQHQYLYNDFWESYISRGFAGLIRISPLPFLALSARASMSTNSYTYDLIRSKGCGDLPSSQPVPCERIDETLNVAASASYIRDKQQALSVIAHYRDHKNDTLKVYDESEFDILFQFTQAFPTLNQASRYIEPFRGIAASRGVY